MKRLASTIRLITFAITPFLLTGCYTQLQTYDRFPVSDQPRSEYYSWDGQEQAREDSRNQKTTASEYPPQNYEQNETGQSLNQAELEEQRQLEQELAMEEAGIYYKDYETEKWYKDHYADKYYWMGYDDGFDRGYTAGHVDAMNNYYLYNYNPWIYHRGYRHHYYYNYNYTNPFYHAPYYGFYWGYGRTGYYEGYMAYNWYGSGYGFGFGYWNYPYYRSVVYYYNDYNRNKRYSRSAELYRKGPRSSGLVRNNGTRTRADVNSTRSYRSDRELTKRSRTLMNGNTNSTSTRVRTIDSRQNSKVTRSTDSRYTGRSTTVRTRTSSSNNTTRSTGRAINTGSRSSNSNDSRISRSRDSNRSIFQSGTPSVRDVNYTIPSRKIRVNTEDRNRFIRRSTNNSRSTFDNSSRNIYESRSRSAFSRSSINNSRSKSSSTSVRSNNNSSRSRSSSVTRSRSSSSDNSRSSRSSSSSSKRSRGN